MSVESVRAQLGEDAELVTIEKVGEYVTVQLREYDLTGEIWRRVNGKLKTLGGEWIGGIGKESHWKIPISSVSSQPTSEKRQLLIKDALEYVDTARMHLEHAIEKLKEAGY